MKKIILGIAAFLTLQAVPVMAQDASYGAQVPRTIPLSPAEAQAMRQYAYQQQYRNMPQRGGRDPRGGFYGRPTVWPGDYKDALDRGSWPAGDRRIMIAPHRQWPD